MITVKLSDEVFKELYILTKSEYDKIPDGYKGPSVFDKNIRTAFLPGHGTTLFFENKHFIVVNDREPQRKYIIWRNHKVIGECMLTSAAAKRANMATNAEFYFEREGM